MLLIAKAQIFEFGLFVGQRVRLTLISHHFSLFEYLQYLVFVAWVMELGCLR